ncbi:Pyridoxine 5'-phosphate synthase [Dissostichus eleginoides]|uniref:Pyridoxine 5'-phosphate synthase n=1 Tax=Dissostichus eleginoides TaxID=100907 RepID=A0AAD9CGY3_DISEL|nr:Pyridoxine 5'-phosphate synthase [Dissostichus eleginoides]
MNGVGEEKLYLACKESPLLGERRRVALSAEGEQGSAGDERRQSPPVELVGQAGVRLRAWHLAGQSRQMCSHARGGSENMCLKISTSRRASGQKL